MKHIKIKKKMFLPPQKVDSVVEVNVAQEYIKEVLLDPDTIEVSVLVEYTEKIDYSHDTRDLRWYEPERLFRRKD